MLTPTQGEGWVTGPALDIIKSLNAFQVGDEVILDACPVNPGHNSMRTDREYYGHVGVISGLEPHPVYPIEISYFKGANARVFCTCQITHWRRPKK